MVDSISKPLLDTLIFPAELVEVVSFSQSISRKKQDDNGNRNIHPSTDLGLPIIPSSSFFPPGDDDDEFDRRHPISSIELVSRTHNNELSPSETPSDNEMRRHPASATQEALVWRKMRYLTFMAAIGGFLFGYDTGVVSGAMLPMRRALNLTPEQQEVVVSSTVFAAFISSLFLGAPLNDRYGRKLSILGSALVFGIGSIVLMVSNGYWMLVVGRIILGLGIGVASLTTPVYIAEVATPELRGRLVTVNTLLITFGQFFAGMVDGFFDYLFPETGWRYMLGTRAFRRFYNWSFFSGIYSLFLFKRQLFTGAYHFGSCQ